MGKKEGNELWRTMANGQRLTGREARLATNHAPSDHVWLRPMSMSESRDIPM